jgi:hypothetical protein
MVEHACHPTSAGDIGRRTPVREDLSKMCETLSEKKKPWLGGWGARARVVEYLPSQV